MRTIVLHKALGELFQRSSGLLLGSLADLCMGQLVPWHPPWDTRSLHTWKGRGSRNEPLGPPVGLCLRQGPSVLPPAWTHAHACPDNAESSPSTNPAEQGSNSQKVGQFKVTVSTATSTQTIWVAEAFSS